MKELEYPFDSSLIIKKKKHLKKELLARDCSRQPVKIAVLGGYTTDDIEQVLELFLLDRGLEPEFYSSEYDQYYQDALFPPEELQKFGPDLIYVCTSRKNITDLPSPSDTDQQIESKFASQLAKYEGMWDGLIKRYPSATIIQNNFEFPSVRLMGNRDVYDRRGTVNFINRLNDAMCGYARSHENFHILDIQYLSASYGLDRWSDPYYWHMFKYAVAVPAIPVLSFELSKIIKAIYGKNKKALALDLDNTLWGGIVGDDGPENLSIGHEVPGGQVFSEFQDYLLSLKNMGILLNVDSKNEKENALAGLRHPDNSLHPDDFIIIKANWLPKDKNLQDIASELNILPDSIVFVDDNPAEREIVKAQLPGVSVPDIHQPEDYIRILDHSGFFEPVSLSKDDLKRNDMYKENAKRHELQAAFTSYDDYLASLDMHATIKDFEPIYLSRISQLTNKSNQFNLTTKRYSQSDISFFAGSDEYITLYGKLSDKFGDNGVVSVAIGKKSGRSLVIDLWLMSCRVLKRGMENAMMDVMIRKARKAGLTEIQGQYLPTPKNKMVKDFYGKMGFKKESEKRDGSSVWSLSIQKGYDRGSKYIDIENN